MLMLIVKFKIAVTVVYTCKISKKKQKEEGNNHIYIIHDQRIISIDSFIVKSI